MTGATTDMDITLGDDEVWFIVSIIQALRQAAGGSGRKEHAANITQSNRRPRNRRSPCSGTSEDEQSALFGNGLLVVPVYAPAFFAPASNPPPNTTTAEPAPPLPEVPDRPVPYLVEKDPGVGSHAPKVKPPLIPQSQDPDPQPCSSNRGNARTD